ncbi:hypothetical protein TorRG33x02_329460, partial [Trema orientale]
MSLVDQLTLVLQGLSEHRREFQAHQKWCAQRVQYYDSFMRFYVAIVGVDTTGLPAPPLADNMDEIEGEPNDRKDDEWGASCVRE